MYHSSAFAADASLRLFTEEPVSDSRGLGIVASQGAAAGSCSLVSDPRDNRRPAIRYL
jgi:hypothetical protein